MWEKELVESMEAAAKEEEERAKEKGHLDPDGLPYITVYLDGGWSKRSYGHNYNAASGVVSHISTHKIAYNFHNTSFKRLL